MAVTYLPTKTGTGGLVLVLSGDTKPSGQTYLRLLETDTGKDYFWNGAAWVLYTSGGSGNVSGPGSSTSGAAAVWNGTGGTVLADSKVIITVPAGNATLTIDNGFTLHATANATVSGTNTGDISSANPTATASDTAVNGSAGTWMRSDAAPAVQKASSSVFGLVKVDGTTITAAAGVISAVAGNGTSAMTLISHNTPTGTGVVTVSSIPTDGTYTHLEVFAYGRGDAAFTSRNMLLTFNNDTAGNYDWSIVQGTGTGTVTPLESHGTTSIVAGVVAAGNATAGYAGDAHIRVINYANASLNKRVLSEAGLQTGTASGATQINTVSGGWRSAAAINRLDLTLASGNWTAGSVVDVYGIK